MEWCGEMRESSAACVQPRRTLGDAQEARKGVTARISDDGLSSIEGAQGGSLRGIARSTGCVDKRHLCEQRQPLGCRMAKSEMQSAAKAPFAFLSLPPSVPSCVSLPSLPVCLLLLSRAEWIDDGKEGGGTRRARGASSDQEETTMTTKGNRTTQQTATQHNHQHTTTTRNKDECD